MWRMELSLEPLNTPNNGARSVLSVFCLQIGAESQNQCVVVGVCVWSVCVHMCVRERSWRYPSNQQIKLNSDLIIDIKPLLNFKVDGDFGVCFVVSCGTSEKTV